MIGVIVTDQGEVVDKRCLFGDDEKNFKTLIEEQKENPGKEYILYNEGEKADFDAVVMKGPQTPEQLSWENLKDKATEPEKLFAKVLGLDA